MSKNRNWRNPAAVYRHAKGTRSPSDYVPWLKDRNFCHIRMEGTTFGNVPLNAEVKLEVWDSPNSAGIVIDALRCAKLALDRDQAGPLIGPSAYFMKSPPVQFSDEAAHEMVEGFILGNGTSARPTGRRSSTSSARSRRSSRVGRGTSPALPFLGPFRTYERAHATGLPR